MFDIQELRLLRYSVIQTMDALKKRQKTLSPESDDYVEVGNDLALYENILAKIYEVKNV